MFIVFEGIDGSGKTTQARMLRDKLFSEGYNVELVADPGTTPLGLALRQLLLNKDMPACPEAQMLMFSAARAELAAYMRPGLALKKVFICDRWLTSTLVYQGLLGGQDLELIRDIFVATTNLVPDLCFLLDLSSSVAGERVAARGGAAQDRFENESLARRTMMRDGYLQYSTNYPTGALVQLDATPAPEAVHSQVMQVFNTVVRAND